MIELPEGKYARVFSWLPAEEIEDGAMQQISNLANLPSAVHVAVMPDAHKGYGMPIGTVLATKGTVVPYAVGVDIGCGMVAIKTSLDVANAPRELVKRALDGIYARVPVGQPGRGRDRDAGSFTERQNSEALRAWYEVLPNEWKTKVRERADRQLGTLGGGNHFIELQSDGEKVWLMLHTGSRSFGKEICDQYHKIALAQAGRYYTPLPDKELAFLSLEDDDGQDYLSHMGSAMAFAEESRYRIATVCLEAMDEAFGGFDVWGRIETHHNFAAIEHHLGRPLTVHRKGAVKTIDGQGLPLQVTIPGSMQTGSYIGLGKSNVLALNTCSHGAGRRLGRNEAKRQVAANPMYLVGDGEPRIISIIEQMAAQGIEIATPLTSDVTDEGGFAYKDIESVMKYQEDLVEPIVRLTPLGVVKG